MSDLGPGTISARDRKELARLRGRYISMPAVVLVTVGILFVWFGITFNRAARDTGLYLSARHSLYSSGYDWAESFVTHQAQYADWISRHGAGFQENIFEGFSTWLFNRTAGISGDMRNLSFSSRTWISFLFALLRIGFIVLVCWRVWLVAVAAGIFLAWAGNKPYRREDALGQTGNGRLFFSGVRVTLDGLDEQGRPGLQTAGLACPAKASLVKTKTSDLGRILHKYGALNTTTLELASVILAHSDYPAYVAERDEQNILSQSYEGTGLVKNAELILESALSLHKLYRTSVKAIDGDLPDGEKAEVEPGSSPHEVKQVEGQLSLPSN